MQCIFNVGDEVVVKWGSNKFFDAVIEKVSSKKVRVVFHIDNSYEDIPLKNIKRIKHHRPELLSEIEFFKTDDALKLFTINASERIKLRQNCLGQNPSCSCHIR